MNEALLQSHALFAAGNFHVDLPVGLGFALIVFFVLLNGFFVAAEFSIVKVRGSQLDHLLEDKDTESKKHRKKVLLAKKITENLDGYLSATQLGITLASIALGIVAEPFVAKLLQSPLAWLQVPGAVVEGVNEVASGWAAIISLAVSFSLATFLHVVLGELMPKSIAIRKALPTTLVIARPLDWFYRAFRPAIWIFNGTANTLLKWFFRIDPISEGELVHSADELRILVAQSEQSQEVTEIEKEILINALDLNDLLARDVMLPRNEVVSLDIVEDFEENYARAVDSQHTRFPLIDGGHLDETLGLIHIKDLMKTGREEDPDLRSIARKLDPVPEMMPLDKLLKSFLANKAHMALVVDEYGGSLGIVTLDNVLEELVGDIHDEFDDSEAEVDDFIRINDNTFEVDGTLPLYELAENSDLTLEDPEVSTVGGYVTHLLGHLPDVGEQIAVQDYLATVTEANGRSIGKLKFERAMEAKALAEERMSA